MNYILSERMNIQNQQGILQRQDVQSLKEHYKQWVKHHYSTPKHLSNIEKNQQTVRVYHATSTYHLPFILEHGLLPRTFTKQSNYTVNAKGEDIASMEEVVYVTNKWHYMMWQNAVFNCDMEGDSYPSPCYIVMDIPTSCLLPDEDAFHLRMFRDRYQQFHLGSRETFQLSGLESLRYYFTAAVPCGIAPSLIKEVTILEHDWAEDTLLNENHPYCQKFTQWHSGEVLLSDFSLRQVKQQEKSHANNRTFILSNQQEKDILLSIFTKEK